MMSRIGERTATVAKLKGSRVTLRESPTTGGGLTQRGSRQARTRAKVMANVLAWVNITPTEAGVEAFFALNERGEKPAWGSVEREECIELQNGWVAHYGDEFGWMGSMKTVGFNPPMAPPAAWIWDSCYSDEGYNGWPGWLNILLDHLRLPKAEWMRKRPVYERAYILAAYLHGRVTIKELKWELARQKT